MLTVMTIVKWKTCLLCHQYLFDQPIQRALRGAAAAAIEKEIEEEERLPVLYANVCGRREATCGNLSLLLLMWT